MFQRGLDAAVDGQAVDTGKGFLCHGPIRQMRRESGKAVARGAHRVPHGRRNRRSVQQPVALQPRQHHIPRRRRDLWRAIRPARLGRLRQGHQQRGLRRGQPRGGPVEISIRGGAHPFDIPAERGMVEIERQDLVLAQPPFQRQRHTDLAQLARPASGAALLQQPRHLHRQGRAARHDPATAQRLPRSAQHRQRIDAAMVTEPLVLVPDQHPQIGGIDLIERHRQTPTPIRHRIGAQHRAIAVQHLDTAVAAQRRQDRGIDPGVHPVPRGTQPPKAKRQCQNAPRHGVIVTRPVSVWARICGRYISSTSAAGWWNSPGDTARTI